MKIICNKSKLSEAVAAVSRAVLKAASIPSLEGIYMDAKEDAVTMYGYNLEMAIRTKIEANVQESGKTCIPAKLLSEIINKMPDKDVSIETEGKEIVRIRSGKSKYKVTGYKPDEFPELPQPSCEHSISIPNNTLKSMIRQTIFAVAKSGAKPIHTGSLFEIGDGKIHMVGVDGYRLAIREETVKCDEQDLHFVVPGNTLLEASRLIPDNDKPCSITIGDRHAMFALENYTIISRLLDGQFLDWRAALPKNSAQTAVVSTNDLMASVQRVALIITDALKSPVRCLFENNSVSLSSRNVTGAADDQCDIEYSGDPLEIGFNDRYLLDALQNTDCDEVRLKLNGPLSPLLISPMAGSSFLFVVLPVRLNGDVA
jgi:DNA polymerase-3 subunit beta